ncbi:MAG TPA: SGNH/GDSL hydrolase family protein [Thermoanaerobaculia bacterium]|nr:SGNH/GDSL hydrolase family protein [Thermoanaerobaculia bacterium]
MRIRSATTAAAISLATLLGLSLGSAALLDLYELVRPPFYRESYSSAAVFAGDREAARVHFREFHRLEVAYQPFVAWRYQPFTGRTITIAANGLRHTPQAAVRGAPVLRVFGGSTVWGMGSADGDTLPAALAHELGSGWQVVNHGQIGYTSRQDVDALLSSLSREEPLTAALFYGGVNDIAAQCRADVSLPGHMDEPTFRQRLAPRRWWLPRLFLEPPAGVLALVRHKLGHDQEAPWICDRDPARAAAVAEEILRVWRLAHVLVQEAGGDFVAAIQPVAYFGHPEHEGVEMGGYPGMRAQFETVYPLLRQRIAAAGDPWIVDLTGALDGGPVAYFDFCHVGPAGNRRVAAALSREVLDRDLLPTPEPTTRPSPSP